MAGRSIGGLCSTVLEFGAGISLEELILRHAVGLPLAVDRARGRRGRGDDDPDSQGGHPARGVGRGGGARPCRASPASRSPPRSTTRSSPLPEGASYLGFIFARGDEPDAVEDALRAAHARLSFRIEPAITLMAVG